MENWRTTLLGWLHITTDQLSWVEQLAYAAIILLVVVLVDRISKIILNKVLSKVVRASKAKWDDVLLDQKVLDKLVAIIPAILLVLFLPFIFMNSEAIYTLAQRLCWIYLVGVVLAFIVSALSALTRCNAKKSISHLSLNKGSPVTISFNNFIVFTFSIT